MSDVKIMSPEELATALFIICALAADPGHFTDDKFGPCSECGQTVRFRPHVPAGPKLICLPCAGPMIVEAMENGEFQAGISEETRKELNRYGKHS